MPDSTGRSQPRVVRIRLPRVRLTRTVALATGVLIMPVMLSACGMLGGGDKNALPVVIPTQATDSGAADSAPAAETTAMNAGNAAPPSAAGATETVQNTVTKTGVVIQERTRTATAVRNVTETAVRTQKVTNTAVVTLPAQTIVQTVTVTAAPVTVTKPGPTTTVTVTKSS